MQNNPLPMQVSQMKAAKKVADSSRKQLTATEKLTQKLDEVVSEYRKTTKAKSVVGSAVREKIGDIKAGFNFDSILRKMIAPIPGSITSNILDNLEEKRLGKKERNESKKQFDKSFFTDTVLGRTVDPKSKKGKDLAEAEFKKIEALNQKKLQKEQEIAKKKELASKMGGIGGPNKKDILELEKINNTIKANAIRIEKGQKAAEKFISGGGGVDSKSSQKEEQSTDMIELLQQIEVNTRPDRTDAADLEKLKEANRKPTPLAVLDDVADVKTPSKAKEAIGGLFDGLFDGLMSGLKFLISPKNILKVLGKVFVPAVIIGSLVNGIMDGFKEYADTGSIGKALIAGIGGVFDFLTFGLINKESVQGVVDYVSEGINSVIGTLQTYIVDPIMSVIDTITEFYDKFIGSVNSVIDSVTGFFFGDKEKKVIKPKQVKDDSEDKPKRKSEKPTSKEQVVLPQADLDQNNASIDKAKREYAVASPKERREIEAITGMSRDELSITPVVQKAVIPTADTSNKVRTEIEDAKKLNDERKNTQNNTVVAPVVNNTANTTVNQKASVRNTEASLNRYLMRA